VVRRSLGTAGHALTGHLARHAHPNAQYPTDGLRSHTDYDGSSDDSTAAFV
jgi:hypothetical protein